MIKLEHVLLTVPTPCWTRGAGNVFHTHNKALIVALLNVHVFGKLGKKNYIG